MKDRAAMTVVAWILAADLVGIALLVYIWTRF